MSDASLGWHDKLLRHPSASWDRSRLCSTLAGMGGWVYILCNKPGGVLYIGVTADLPARMMQHREGRGSAFCRKYGIKRLVHAEHHPEITDAISREKAMKAWKRSWKIELIEKGNPEWDDLFERLNW